jgi:hypothetical protein
MNTLYYGDNLDVMRKFIRDETVDLCYIDPPFNSKRNYNQIYNNIGTYNPSPGTGLHRHKDVGLPRQPVLRRDPNKQERRADAAINGFYVQGIRMADQDTKKTKYQQRIDRLKIENPVRREKQRQFLLANADCFTGWEWLAPKQPRSCAFCIAMDGRIFPLQVSFESVNHCESEYCRCTMIAVIVGIDRLPRELGCEWFAALPEADKKKMLGGARYDEYVNGKSLEEIFEI